MFTSLQKFVLKNAQYQLFSQNRWVFKDKGTQETAGESKEAEGQKKDKLKAKEEPQIANEINDKLKEKGVDVPYKRNPQDTFKALAAKLFPDSKEKQAKAVTYIESQEEWKNPKTGADELTDIWAELAKKGCHTVGMGFFEDGAKLTFINAKGQMPKSEVRPVKLERSVVGTQVDKADQGDKAEKKPEKSKAQQKKERIEREKGEEVSNLSELVNSTIQNKLDQESFREKKIASGTKASLQNVNDLKLFDTKEGVVHTVSPKETPNFNRNVIIDKDYSYEIKSGTKSVEFVHIVSDTSKGQQKTIDGWILRSRLNNEQVPEHVKTDVAIDTLSQEELKKEAEGREKYEKEANVRGKYLKDNEGKPVEKDAKSGVIALPKGEKDVKLIKLFPTAIVGDRITVTPKGQKNAVSAVYKGGVWAYTEGSKKGKEVILKDGDKLSTNFNPEFKDNAPKVPTNLPEGARLLDGKPHRLTEDQMEKVEMGEFNWNAVAKELYANPEFKLLKSTHIKEDAYARDYLKKYSDNRGYYWVILPPQESLDPDAIARKQIESQTKEGKEQAKIEKALNDRRNRDAWRKWGKLIKENDLMDVAEKDADRINKLIDNRLEWNKAWAANYPLNREAILAAFNNEPYNNIPKEQIRDGLREALANWTNGLKFSTLFKFLNKDGKFYRSPEGKTDYDTYYNEVIDARRITTQIQENKDAGRMPLDGLDDDEKNYFRNHLQFSNRYLELLKVQENAAPIFDVLHDKFFYYGKAPVAIETPDIKAADKGVLEANRKYVFEYASLSTNDNMDEYINDEKKWNKMWENNEGNIKVLKDALQRPPYNRIPDGAQKVAMRKAMSRTFGNKVDMVSIFEEMNKNGDLYAGGDGDYEDFVSEYGLQNLGARVRARTASQEEQERYDDLSGAEKAELTPARYTQLRQLAYASAGVMDAVSRLDSMGSNPIERVDKEKQAQANLDAIFPPSDTGSAGGEKQDAYNVSEKRAVAEKPWYKFSSDYNDAELLNISDIDKVSSASAANRLILDQVTDANGQVNEGKYVNRMNQLIRLGIRSVLLRPTPATEDARKARREQYQKLGLRSDQINLLVPQGDEEETAAQASRRRMALEAGSQELMSSLEKQNKVKDSKTPMTEAQKNLVRYGFIIERTSMPSEVREVSERERRFSENPETAKLQRAALRLNPEMNQKEMDDMADKMQSTMIAVLHMRFGDNFSGVDNLGLGAGFKVAENVYLGADFTWSFAKDKPILSFGVGGSKEVVKGSGVRLLGGVGIDTEATAFVGGGVNIEIPVDKDATWKPDMTLGAMLAIRLGKGNPEDERVKATLGLALKFERDLAAEFRGIVKEDLAKAGYKAVEEAKTPQEKAELLRALPGNGKVFAQIQNDLALSDAELVNFYERHVKNEIRNDAALGYVPLVTRFGFGVGVEIGKGGFTPIPGVLLGITIGSQMLVYQRPVESDEARGQSGEKIMQGQAIKRIRENAARQAEAAGQSIKFIDITDDKVFGATGQRYRARISSEQAALMEPTPGEKPPVDAINENFKKFQAEMLKRDMILEKDPETQMYKLKINKTGELRVYVDPTMAEKMGVFLRNGEIYISASQNPKLAIKRFDDYLARPKDGVSKVTIVTISDKELAPMMDQTDSDGNVISGIVNRSDFYLISRNPDVKGDARMPLQIMGKAGVRARQYNLREWSDAEAKAGKYAYFDNLGTETAGVKGQKEYKEKTERYSALSKDAQESLGLSEKLKGERFKEIRKKAQTFEKKHPTEYRQLTTHQIKSKPDLDKLDALIQKDNGGKLTFDELMLFKEELFNLSMSEMKNQPEAARERIMKERLEWARDYIYKPFFQEKIKSGKLPAKLIANLRKTYKTDEELAAAMAEGFVEPLRKIKPVKGEAQKIPLGASVDVAVGSNNIVGIRGSVMGNQEITEHGLYSSVKDYRSALETGKPPMDQAIALALRDNYSPNVEKMKDNEFLRTPLAAKIMYLGVQQNKYPVLADLLGEDNYRKLLDCFEAEPKPAVVEGSEEAVKAFQELVTELQDASEGRSKDSKIIAIDGEQYHAIERNGMVMGLKVGTFRSGVYERCLNAASVYDDKLVAFRSTETYTPQNEMAVYNAKQMQTLVSNFGASPVGFGVAPAVGLKGFVTGGPGPSAGPSAAGNQATTGSGSNAEEESGLD